MTTRPRRSVLYLPASNPRALAKARDLDVDGVILDLEDAVAPDAKREAREAACQAVIDGGFGHREVIIRINGLGTPWHDDDLRFACLAGPDAIAVPKVTSTDDIATLEAGFVRHGAPTRTQLWAMLETPAAILHAEAIACAATRLGALVLGTNDLVKELGARHVAGRAPLLTSLCLAVLAARSAGVPILDGVYNDITDLDGFAAECRQSWELGFDGKTLIHPGQIAAANAQWTPAAGDIDDARELIAAFDSALAAGHGVVTFRGRMIENLHVAQARATLALADALAAR
ncbi:MAG: HpcH/HpaI aldolase/citrate lyase family protein [Propionibacteriaceae bacterium]